MIIKFSKKANLRSPFKLEGHSLLSKIYCSAHTRSKTPIKRFILRPIAKSVFKILWKLGIKSNGRFLYTNHGETSLIPFNARNTQFHSIYLPEMQYYEPETTSLLDIIVGPNDVFYDIGANWGHYSLYLLSNPNFKGKIYAFEPEPNTFKDLTKSISHANVVDRIECLELGISDKNGSAFINIPDGMHSGLATVSRNKSGYQIKLTNLDSLQLPGPDIMKVDVENLEHQVFQGGKKTIAEFKPKIIFENFLSDQNFSFEPFTILSELGYLFFYPVFHTEKGNIKMVETEQWSNPIGKENLKLGLWQFDPEERYFLPRHCNIFAAHESTLEELDKAFKE